MRHFLYQHLPAGGLGYRDPIRPYVTGGLGRAIVLVYPPTLLRMRVRSVENRTAVSAEVEGAPA